jgi:hypothetical protein
MDLRDILVLLTLFGHLIFSILSMTADINFNISVTNLWTIRVTRPFEIPFDLANLPTDAPLPEQPSRSNATII